MPERATLTISPNDKPTTILATPFPKRLIDPAFWIMRVFVICQFGTHPFHPRTE